MELAVVGWSGARVVVEARGQDVVSSAASPAVRLGSGSRASTVWFEKATLGPTEPEVVAAESGVDGRKIGVRKGRVHEV